jgi:hypothetical protein
MKNVNKNEAQVVRDGTAAMRTDEQEHQLLQRRDSTIPQTRTLRWASLCRQPPLIL